MKRICGLITVLLVLTALWNGVLFAQEDDPPIAADDDYSTEEDITLDVAAPGVLDNDNGTTTVPLGDTLGFNDLTELDDFVMIYGSRVSAQTFSHSADFHVSSVQLRLSRQGNTGTVTVGIMATDASGHPTGGYLASAAFPATDLQVTPTYEWHDVPLTLSGLTMNTTYALVVDTSGGDSYNYIAWRVDTTSPSYDGGNWERSIDNGFTWTTEDRDGGFQVQGTETVTATLTAVLDTGPSNGILALNADGSFGYTPDSNFNGTDSFTYHANDGSADSNTATVTITVNPVNDPPVATDDTATTDEDTPVTIDVLANDTDVDGDLLQVSSVTAPTNGKVVNNGDGTLTYDPNGQLDYLAVGEWTTDKFTYTASDGHGGTDTGLVTITINGVNDAPTANNDTDSTDEDTAVTVSVLSNDTDPDTSDVLRITSVSDPANGSVIVNADDTVTYIPDLNYNGSDYFTYDISDAHGGSDSATVYITVSSFNAPPVALDDTYSTDEDTILSVAAPGVLSNDSDVDGDTLTASLVDDVDNGTLTFNPDGSLEYTPDSNFNGTDSFTYVANDGQANSNIATVTITVNPVNDPPVATADTATTDEDTPVTIDVLANDTDVDGDTLSVDFVSPPANGTAVINGDGTITYTPDGDYNGSDSFGYTISDGNGGTDTTDVLVTINPVNDPPAAIIAPIDDQIIVLPVTIKVTPQTLNLGRSGNWVKVHIKDESENTPQEMTIYFNGSASYDVDGDTLSYHWTLTGPEGDIVVPDGVSGQVVLSAGSYTLTLVINDGTADSAPETETFTLTNETLSDVADAEPDEFTLNGTPGSEVNGGDNSVVVSFACDEVATTVIVGLNVEMVLEGRVSGNDYINVIQDRGKSELEGGVGASNADNSANGNDNGSDNAPGQNK